MKDNTYYGSNDGTSYCLFENPVLRTGVQKETTHFAGSRLPAGAEKAPPCRRG